MNVLVTGATGFVGSHVVDVLLDRGYDVSYVARATSNHRWLDGKRARRVDGSLFDHTSLRQAISEADAVIHVAGLTAAKSESEYVRGNRDATQNLIDAALAYRPNLSRFVHISSLAVCGPARDAEHPVLESDSCRPLTAYGRTKKMAEDVVNGVADQLPITIVRPPAVYGPRDEATLTFFQTIGKGLAPLIGFDEKFVSFIHVKDLARGIVDAMEKPAGVGQTYFITSSGFHTWPEISTVSAAVMGKRRILKIKVPHALVLGIAGTVGLATKLGPKPSVLNYEKGIDFIQKYWICSPEKSRRDLGFTQQISLQDGIRDTVAWYHDMGWL